MPLSFLRNDLWLAVILSSCFILGCQNKQKRSFIESPEVSGQDVQFSVDSLTMDAGELGLFHYPIFSSTKIDGTNYFFGWNNKVNQLEVFDLDSRKLSNTLKYEMEGPDGLEEVKGLEVVSFDSILFMSKTYVLLADTTKVYQSWGINERNVFEGFDKARHNLTTEESFNIEFDRSTKKLYTRLHYPSYPWCDRKLRYYQQNLIAELDLTNNTFSEVDFDFPDQYHHYGYGFRDIPNVTFSNSGQLNVTFTTASNVYQVDLINNTEAIYGGISEYTDNLAKPLEMNACEDIEARMKHNLRNVKFLQIHHDPYRDLYYRFHWGNVSEQKADGRYSSYRDKKLYLTVFDEGMAKIKEWEIDRKHGASWCFVNENGLHVLKPRGKENLLGFNVFKFERVNDESKP